MLVGHLHLTTAPVVHHSKGALRYRFDFYFIFPYHLYSSEKTLFGRSLWNEWYNNRKTIPVVVLDGPRPSDQGENRVLLTHPFVFSTLLGLQSRFGDELFTIWLLCPHKWECGAKRWGETNRLVDAFKGKLRTRYIVRVYGTTTAGVNISGDTSYFVQNGFSFRSDFGWTACVLTSFLRY